MKKLLFVCSLLLVTISGIRAQQTYFTELAGPYLGQKPPGMTPEIFAPDILSTGSHELDITITPDGKEILFTRSGPDWFSSVLHFKLTTNGWSGPLISELTSGFQNNYPFVSPDGQRIFYNSQKPVSDTVKQVRNNNIYISEKISGVWSEGIPLGHEVNNNQTEMFVSVASSGNIYLCAKYDDSIGGFDIYMAEYKEGKYSNAVNLGSSINTGSNEFHPFIAPDESYIIFDAQRPEGFGANDLYISFKNDDGTWSVAKNMGEKINTEYSDLRPYVSPDGKYFFFCSNRVTGQEQYPENPLSYNEFQNRIAGPGNGFQDIYWVEAKIIEEIKNGIELKQ